MAWLISLRDLQWRRRRFGIAVVANALVLALGLLLSGVSASFDNEIRRTVDSFEADAWLVRAGSFGPFTGPATIPATTVEEVRSQPGIERADPIAVLRALTTTPSRRNINLIGAVPGGLGSSAEGGTPLARRDAAIVDDSLELGMGDRIDLNGSTFRVAELTDGMTYFAGIPTVTVTLRQAQRLGLDGRPLATAILTQGRPEPVPAGLTLLENRDVEADLERPIHQAKQTISFIRFLLWAVAAGIVGAIVYLSVLERVGDFAVFKAIGVSTRNLLAGLVLQAVLLSLVSALLAIGLEAAIAPAVAMSVEVPTLSFLTLPLLAVLVGALASLFGLRRALSVDPALAFGMK